MDELKITSRLMRGIISKAISSILYKKLGYKVDVHLEDLNVCISDEKAHVHFSASADMSIDEFKKFNKFIDNE